MRPAPGKPARSHFTCADCGGTFEKGWSDEEARAELENNYPNLTEDQCDLVCDNCWEKMPEWMKSING